MKTTMDVPHEAESAQAGLWNGAGGRAWVEGQDLLDRMLQPFEEILLKEVPAGIVGRVLDVGCGTGSTTLAVTRLLGAKGSCTGIDISEPMIACARARAKREGAAATFIRANAQSYAFEPAS